jgi:hypothetical protein
MILKALLLMYCVIYLPLENNVMQPPNATVFTPK